MARTSGVVSPVKIEGVLREDIQELYALQNIMLYFIEHDLDLTSLPRWMSRYAQIKRRLDKQKFTIVINDKLRTALAIEGYDV